MTVSIGAFVFPGRQSRAWPRAGEPSVAPSPLTGLTRAFAIAIVFIAGWYLCLPESPEFVTLPSWARKIAVGPNVLVHELLFAGYLVVGGGRLVLRGAFRVPYVTLSAAVFLGLLAVWCGTTSLLSPLPVQDFGRSGRLILMAFLLLGVTHWTAGNPLLVLRTFLFGLVGSTVVNLALTLMNPVGALVLPRLLGQNAPGPPMGIAVCLAAWLILLSRGRLDTILGMTVAVICGVGAMISYSKTGMLAAVMGFVSIALVSGKVAPSRRGRILVTAFFGLLLAASSYLGSDLGRPIWGAFSQMVTEKVESAEGESGSVQERWSYVLGVSEIVVTHPLGVGYSGFKNAMMKTDAYFSGRAADESANTDAESNPHSLFLYYASAGGLIGGLLCAIVFLLLCRALWSGLALYGMAGALLALFCMAGYLVMATSVPYLFNSSVMLVPAALAAGIHARVRGAVDFQPAVHRVADQNPSKRDVK